MTPDYQCLIVMVSVIIYCSLSPASGGEGEGEGAMGDGLQSHLTLTLSPLKGGEGSVQNCYANLI
jgi:hypothetical protein